MPKEFTVLRHGAAGDDHALRLELGHDLIVGEHLRRALAVDHPLDLQPDRLSTVRLLAAGRGEGGREKVLQGEGSMRGRDVFLRGGAADGALVQAGRLGDVAQHERPQMLGTAFEEGKLAGEDRLDDAQHRARALVERLGEPVRRLHPLAQIVLGIAVQRVPGELRMIVGVDQDAGQGAVVELDPPAAARHGQDEEVGHDDGRLVGGEAQARLGVEPLDLLRSCPGGPRHRPGSVASAPGSRRGRAAAGWRPVRPSPGRADRSRAAAAPGTRRARWRRRRSARSAGEPRGPLRHRATGRPKRSASVSSPSRR